MPSVKTVAPAAAAVPFRVYKSSSSIHLQYYSSQLSSVLVCGSSTNLLSLYKQHALLTSIAVRRSTVGERIFVNKTAL